MSGSRGKGLDRMPGVSKARPKADPAMLADTSATRQRVRKVTVALSVDQHDDIKALAHELGTTQRAVLLATVEMLGDRDPKVIKRLRSLTADGRLEGKRGPKGTAGKSQ